MVPIMLLLKFSVRIFVHSFLILAVVFKCLKIITFFVPFVRIIVRSAYVKKYLVKRIKNPG